MNNPMQTNFMRSPGGPPIAKKQRGGSTPGSIRARPRAPPRKTSGERPPSSVDSSVDDAIARRRAELRRLQEKARGSRARETQKVSSTASLIPPPGEVSKRSSDIFPSVHPKSPSVAKPKADATPMLTNEAEDVAAAPAPALPLAENPKVGRRLDYPKPPRIEKDVKPEDSNKPGSLLRRARSKSPVPASRSFSEDRKAMAAKALAARRDRAKSAPPRRPPGPPPRLESRSSNKGPPKKESKRPVPVPLTSLLPKNNNQNEKTIQKNDQSIPNKDNTPAEVPSEPPKGPPKEPLKESSKSSKKGPPPKAAPKGPPLLGPSTVAAKETPVEQTTTTKESTEDPMQAPQLEPTASQTPTAMATTNSPDILEALTPTAQRSTFAAGDAAHSGSGSVTPPSSGSSARRQKLQLMREQAAAAQSLSNIETTFHTGPPVTEAFAKAIGAVPTIPDLIPKSEEIATKKSSSGYEKTTEKVPETSKPHSVALSRLEDAYQKAEHEKTAALIKIKELEDKLAQKAKEETAKLRASRRTSNSVDVNRLLSLAETQGPEAALQWAKSMPLGDGSIASPTRPASQVGFNTGFGVNNTTPRKTTVTGTNANARTMDASNGPGSLLAQSPLRRARIATRNLTPIPSQKRSQHPHTQSMEEVGPHESPEDTERRLIRSFREAAEFVPFEFSSEIATYTVRRPYGISTNPGLFDHCRPPQEDSSLYAKRAHVSDKTTIEIAAVVKADKTPVLVFGSSGIRYQTNPNDQWKHVDSADALGRPLGHVTYIDGEANEKEYSMDEILEEALLVREQYCGTLTSTAIGLEGRPPLAEVRMAEGPPPDLQKAPSKDVGVGTETVPESSKHPPPQQQPQQRQQQPHVEKADEGSSSDILVVFLGMVLSFLMNLIWGIFIGTPVRILRTVIVLAVAIFILQALHFYIADDYNSWALQEMGGAGISITTSDLAYYSNRQPGIL